MNKGQWLALGIVLIGGHLGATTFQLPSHFYPITSGTPRSLISVKGEDPLFYIIVPESPIKPSTDKQKLIELVSFTENVTVPADFFGKSVPEKPTSPVTLFFDWQEQENGKLRKQAAQDLAHGINTLRRRFKKSKLIVVGHGQGGNVINAASNSVLFPLETVIELSTPVFPCKDKNDIAAYGDYLPNKKKIKRLFSFYSEQAFSILHPTLHPNYQHIYSPEGNPHLKNILLLINNKHPLPNEMLRPLIGNKLLELCHKIGLSYRLHNHLVAHLSTIKKEADMVVVLRDKSLNIASHRPTQSILKERLKSRSHTQKFQEIWGRPLALSLGKGEQSRKRYETIQALATHTPKRG